MSAPEYQVKQSTVDGGRLTLQVEVAAPVVARAYKDVHKRLLNYVAVPGFRNGKAPMDVVIKRVGPERFSREVEGELLPRYYYEALESQPHLPAGEVEYQERKLDRDQPFVFTAAVDVEPPVSMGDYGALAVTAIPAEEVGQEQLQRELRRLQRRVARLSTPDEGARVSDATLVHFKYEGTSGGKAYKSLTGTTSLLIGDDDFLPGFGEHLKGMAKGDEKVFAYQMPDDYEPKHLAGAKVEFRAKVMAFQAAALPAIDDEFAKDVGAFASLDELKGRIERDLSAQATRRREERYAQKLREALLVVVKAEVPRARLDRLVEKRLEDMRERASGTNMTLEEHLAEEGKTLESLKAEVAEQEERDARLDCALYQIALKEKVTVTDDEVVRRIALTAQVLGRDVAEIRDILDATGSRILKKYDLMREKAFALLKERNRAKAGLPAASTIKAPSLHDHAHDHDHEHDDECDCGHDHHRQDVEDAADESEDDDEK